MSNTFFVENTMDLAGDYIPTLENARLMLKYFHDHQGIGDKIPMEPEGGSIGFAEMKNPTYSKHIRNVIWTSETLAHLTHDFVSAGHKLLDPKAFSRFAFTANARASMECAARIKWLLSPNCNARERSIRSLRARLSGLREQRNAIQAQLNRRQADLNDLSREFDQKHGIITEEARVIGERNIKQLPGASDLIRSELNAEPLYRYFSGVVHGHWYAVRDIGYQLIDEVSDNESNGKLVRVEPKFNAMATCLATLTVCECYATAVWYSACFRLASTLEIEEFLDNGFDLVNLPDRRRFWRSR